jgi:hypothetical protein
MFVSSILSISFIHGDPAVSKPGRKKARFCVSMSGLGAEKPVASPGRESDETKPPPVRFSCFGFRLMKPSKPASAS